MERLSSEINKACKRISLFGLETGAVKISLSEPFLGPKGTYHPIHIDSQMCLFDFRYRDIIANEFARLISISGLFSAIIAGTSMTGISWATSLADFISAPLIYINDKPKSYGLKHQIEGIDANKDLENKQVVLIHDLISTGKNCINAINAIRKAGGVCRLCLSIFNYGLPNLPEMFAGDIPYNDKGEKLSSRCEVKSLVNYPKLVSIAIENGLVEKKDEKKLLDWIEDPETWGRRYGFSLDK